MEEDFECVGEKDEMLIIGRKRDCLFDLRPAEVVPQNMMDEKVSLKQEVSAKRTSDFFMMDVH